jgi:hypothetical protein
MWEIPLKSRSGSTPNGMRTFVTIGRLEALADAETLLADHLSKHAY